MIEMTCNKCLKEFDADDMNEVSEDYFLCDECLDKLVKRRMSQKET